MYDVKIFATMLLHNNQKMVHDLRRKKLSQQFLILLVRIKGFFLFIQLYFQYKKKFLS